MIDLYDYEIKEIYSTVASIQKKWWGKPNTGENMSLLAREIQGKLEDIGFKAIVDPTPTIEGEPVDVRIEDRVEQIVFDPDKKAAEIKKSRREGGI